MDTVFIQKLKVESVIGVYERERNIVQPLVLDIEVDVDTRVAGLSDALNDAVDYAAISARCIQFAADSRFHLLEAFANRLAEVLIGEFELTQVRLKVFKPTAVDEADSVGVAIERSA